MSDFIPRRWGDRVNWLNNVKLKIATHLAYGVLGDEQIGLPSDIVSVTFGG